MGDIMNLRDIEMIEMALSVCLPDSYKESALESKLQGNCYESRFYNDPKKVIKMNKRLRDKGLYGQIFRDNHFAIGYEKEGEIYYFIDLNVKNGCVYQADRTKAWRYSPDDISKNEMRAYSTIEKYIRFMYDLYLMVNKSDVGI